MFGLGTGELILIGIIAFLFVGPKKLPQLGASLAKSLKNFKKGMAEQDSNNTEESIETVEFSEPNEPKNKDI